MSFRWCGGKNEMIINSYFRRFERMFRKCFWLIVGLLQQMEMASLISNFWGPYSAVNNCAKFSLKLQSYQKLKFGHIVQS